MTKDELKEVREILDRLKRHAYALYNRFDQLPPFLMATSLYEFIDDIKYMSGYLDCMIKSEKPHTTP